MFHAIFPHLGLIHLVSLVGYPGLFVAVFLESGVFFGFFLPGSSMLFTAGLLATQGLFNIWILIPLLSIAAILGDSAGYWFGNVVGPALYKREDSRFFKQHHLTKARAFYERHGVQAVILARFIPIVRTFAPIIAGIAGMKYRVFLSYNIIGGILWAAGITFMGYFTGIRIPHLASYITPIALLIIVVSCVPIYWELRKPKPLPERNQ